MILNSHSYWVTLVTSLPSYQMNIHPPMSQSYGEGDGILTKMW